MYWVIDILFAVAYKISRLAGLGDEVGTLIQTKIESGDYYYLNKNHYQKPLKICKR